MSDRDDKSPAWNVPPSHYLSQRPEEFSSPAIPVSQYITMRDGCRLAADVYIPQGAPHKQRFPTLLIFTPYYRRFETDGNVTEAAPASARYRDLFVPRGYVVVTVDVRGTGASFGTRDALRSPTERDDYGEVAQWVVEQSWSNAVIGSTGISYVGAAACFLASKRHPAVKAIAPLFGVSDIYSEQLYPGGLLSKVWIDAYSKLMIAMDSDRRDLIGRFSYYQDPGLRGPHRTDEDFDGRLLAAAIREHRSNFSLSEAAPEFSFRDESLLHDPAVNVAACSPYHYLDQIPREVPIYSVSGWFDGAGYANGAITRFLTRANEKDRLLLGPWDHGARTNVSPWREQETPQFNILAELLRFFDTYLMGHQTNLHDEARIHYYSIHAEEWHSSASWPPPSQRTRLHLSAGNVLAEAGGEFQVNRFKVDFETTTGKQTRYERLGAANIVDYYPDWSDRSLSMLHYDTAPLSESISIACHATATLRMSIDQGDASIFVYLSEVDSEGRIFYITEGMLRAIHRKTSDAPANYVTAWPFRSYSRADASRVTAGVAEDFTIPLLPVAWTLKKGSKLRLSISGADAGHYVPMPYGRPPVFSIHVGASGSFLDLPVSSRRTSN
ncbi:CocE/NonD family hydrolase [Burkholderia cepacia]|uniref:CocE/NonD family hydrolase n=1 Tax=Burkholderia cepacia TaxID=292 RepID=UPI0009BCBC52|nr:CocE/NonD family hydrolase [Burkholderia cepacia]